MTKKDYARDLLGKQRAEEYINLNSQVLISSQWGVSLEDGGLILYEVDYKRFDSEDSEEGWDEWTKAI